MGVRSDVGLAVKSELIEELREKHPWVFEEADDELSQVEGKLFIFQAITWYDFGDGKVAKLCDWLKSKDASPYRLVQACYEDPDPEDSSSSGEWLDNP
jgi:hypothetical protein